MTKEQRQTLKRCSTGCVGKSVFFKFKGKSTRYLLGTVADVVSIIVSDYNHMIQRIELTPKIATEWGERYAYRTCYYTLTRKSRKLAWGQYHALVPEWAYHQLARKAHAKGWLGLHRKGE